MPYYEGTPIPTSLLLVAILGVLESKGLVDTAFPFGVVQLGTLLFHPFVLIYAVSGTLMASASLPDPEAVSSGHSGPHVGRHSIAAFSDLRAPRAQR